MNIQILTPYHPLHLTTRLSDFILITKYIISIGRYICNEYIDPYDNSWGYSIVKPHILEQIDACFKELSSIYSDETSFDLIDDLLAEFMNSIEYEHLMYFIDLYKKENGYK